MIDFSKKEREVIKQVLSSHEKNNDKPPFWSFRFRKVSGSLRMRILFVGIIIIYFCTRAYFPQFEETLLWIFLFWALLYGAVQMKRKDDIIVKYAKELSALQSKE